MASKRNGIMNFVQRATVPKDSLQGVKELYLSKLEKQNIKKYPEWDVPKVCPEFELLKARRQLDHAEQKLHVQRVQQAEKRKQMDEQWNELRRREQVLRESFIKFNKFIKDNEEKRERAHQKIEEERERQEKYSEEIADLSEKVNYMRETCDKFKKYVEMYKVYQTYLEKVINETGDFQSIADIFRRYESLVEARISLLDDQEQYMRTLEHVGNELHRMTETKSKTLLRLNTKLSSLQGRYDKAKVRALKWEILLSKTKTVIADKYLELTRLRACCRNVYHQICKRKGIPPEVPDDNIELQLIHIKRTIMELRRIIQVAKERTEEARLLGNTVI